MTRTERHDPPWSILERGTGDWSGEETMPPAPWAPEGLDAVGTLTAKLVFDGRGLVSDYTQEVDGEISLTSHTVIRWDEERNVFMMHFFAGPGEPRSPRRERGPRQAVRRTIHAVGGGLSPMARTLLLACLLLLGAGAAQPIDVGAQDAAGVFERLEGTWAGPGTLFGQPAAFTMRWDVSGGLASLRFTNALVDADGSETPVMSAAAVYRIDGEPTGVWLDSRGERVELTWTVADGALVVDWRASTESGRTTYRPVDADRVEVVDEVAADDGWRVFGTAAHARIGPTPVPPAAPPGPLDVVAFMAGTWCSTPPSGGTMIEEHYTTPSTNLVLGTTRYLRDGAAVGHEITRIEADSAGVVLTPTPSGQAAVPFRLTESAPGRATFENPEHDFPVRIEYERVGDELVARALGADGTGPEWRMSPCRGGPPTPP